MTNKQKERKLTCEKHSRILIGKDKCVDCEAENTPKTNGWEIEKKEFFANTESFLTKWQAIGIWDGIEKLLDQAILSAEAKERKRCLEIIKSQQSIYIGNHPAVIQEGMYINQDQAISAITNKK